MTARIVVIGSQAWRDRARTKRALIEVMEKYRGPYVLIHDATPGAATYAAVVAQELGWTVEPYPFDPSLCGPKCPTTNHRRQQGPSGQCSTATARNLVKMLDTGIDLCVALTVPGHRRQKGERNGQEEVRRRDIAIWTYATKAGKG